MIDKPTAQNSVLVHINTHRTDNELVIVRSIDKPYGWIFFYDSKKYLETRDMRYAIAGNAPIVVEKEDGSLHFLNTTQTVEEMIADYEKRRQNKWCLGNQAIKKDAAALRPYSNIFGYWVLAYHATQW